jgi:hypothetical protein
MLTNNQDSKGTNKGKGINRMNGKMIFKFAAVAAIVCVASAARVYAATIALGADDTTYFGLANGNALPAPDAVYMGEFTITDTQIAALMSGGTVSAANYATLVSDFVPLNGTGFQPIGTGTGGDAGSIGATFASGAIHLLVVNTATTVGASQVGVFTGSALWAFPASMATGSTSIDTDNALTAPLIGAYAASLDAASKGYTFDADSGNDLGNIAALELATVVPEPSTYLLVGTGLLGLLALRRRS